MSQGESMGIQTNSVRRMGSRSWVTEVFNSPPAREVKGRSRPTQRYVARDDAGQISYAEGGNTAVARGGPSPLVASGRQRRPSNADALCMAERGVPGALFCEARQSHLGLMSSHGVGQWILFAQPHRNVGLSPSNSYRNWMNWGGLS